MVGRYVILLVLVIMSAFFSSSETAFSSVNIIRLRNAREEGRRGSKIALYVADHFDKTLSAILIGNNIVNIATASLATIIAIDQFGEDYGAIIATVVTTIFILIFGEIIPKSYAKENALKFCLTYGWFLLFFIRIFTPFIFIVVRIKNLFTKVFDKDGNFSHPSVTEDELDVIIGTMEEEGVIEEDERDMIRSVLDLSETNVYDIMTPRVDMVGVYLDDEIEYIKDLFLSEKFSRMPVYDDSKDNVVGVLYERDFFHKLIQVEDRSTIAVSEIMKKPLFVPKSMHVDALIELLQHNKQHLAVVSDEYGGTSGLVTMEDCLEELVGEIYDEHDEEDFEIKVIDSFNFDVNASVPLDDLFEELELGKAPETHYNSVGGWLYEQLEEIPHVGDQHVYTSFIKIENDITTMEDDQYIELTLTFSVKELQDRRMKTIHLNIIRNEIGKEQNGKQEIADDENKIKTISDEPVRDN